MSQNTFYICPMWIIGENPEHFFSLLIFKLACRENQLGWRPEIASVIDPMQKLIEPVALVSIQSTSVSKAHTGGLRGKVSRYLTGKRSEGKRDCGRFFLW